MFGITEDGTYRVERIGFSTPTLDSGYVVAIRPLKREADIVTEGALFGRWTDEDGTVYWDEVEVIGNVWYALMAAKVRGEIAIWDIARGTELRVADYYPTEQAA
jgi:hypothetical protein